MVSDAFHHDDHDATMDTMMGWNIRHNNHRAHRTIVTIVPNSLAVTRNIKTAAIQPPREDKK
jgi:uncharacterized protein YeaC (DUF1315 family)